jgi:hypothetical protein
MTITAERPTAVVTSQTPPDVRLSTELTLVAVSTAVGCAGRLVRCTLQDWGIGRTEVKAAELRTAELATNAVQAIAASHRLNVISIRVLHFGRSVVIEVKDGDPRPPILQDPHPDFHWDYYLPNGGGKVVWFELGLPRRPLDDDTVELSWLLPLRHPKYGSALAMEAENDPELLQRVRDGLRALDVS